MFTYDKSVIPIIESSYSHLTTVEKIIADYFLENVQEEDLSSKNVSKKLFVSEAALSRFAKKIGFKGYREFVFAYRQSHQQGVSLDALTRQVLNSYQKVLEKTYSLIDNQQMIRISQMFEDYKRVYVYGIGSSALVAKEFKLRFMRLGLDVDYLAESHSIKMNITRIQTHSLVIGISVSGRTEEVINGLREAKNKGAKTILISAKKILKYKEYYDEIVLIGGLKNLAISNKISPQIPALIVIDILYNHYLHYDYSKKNDKLNMTLEYVDYKEDI